MSLRILMMGTGTFALPTFRALLQSSHQVVGLITQPDREHRGQIHPHPMKELAVQHQVPVLQPVKVNSPESLEAMRNCRADLMVVAAYGQILSAKLLAIPRLGAINLHGSLLPKYRGAAPIQYAVLNGECETGVTIFQIEPQLDAGPMYGTVRTPIGPEDTSGTVHDRLAELAAPLTLEVLAGLEAGTLRGTVQDAGGVTKAPKIPKEFGDIDWSLSSHQIDCHVRAMQPWPLAWSTFTATNGKAVRLIVLNVEAVASNAEALPGTVLASPPGTLLIKTGDGAVSLRRVQPTGKRPMDIAEFLRGTPVPAGIVLRKEIANQS